MKRLWLLLVAVSAVVTAPSPDTSCIDGCQCKEDKDNLVLKIYDCNGPLTLSNTTMANFSKKINTLGFENVKIDKIDKTTFDGFNDLDTFVFKDAAINSIDPTAFDLPELVRVSFTAVTFAETPYLSCDYLEELVFTDCQLTDMPKLDKLPALRLIGVPNNRIESIEESVFIELENLEEVTLSNNSLSKLPQNLFDNNPQLNTLTLDNNPLKSFELNSLQNLEVLSLRSCKLTTFDENASRNLNAVSQLDLSNNEISILALDAFATMPDLLYMNLSSNGLVEIDANIFENNNKLNRIELDNNKFVQLPQFVSSKKQFLTVHFSCNNCTLKSLTGVFDNMPGIISLSLANNEIDNVEHIFESIHSLKDLNLSNNKITRVVSNAFANNSALESLNLKGNPLKPLDPVVFANINGLKKLDVSSTGLSQLWTNHNSILPTLEQLLIANNNLTLITVDDLNVTPNVKLMDLENNPLNCTQELHDSMAWLLKKAVYPIRGARTHEAVMLPDVAAFAEYSQSVTAWKKYCFGNAAFDDDDDEDDDDDDDDDDEDDEDGTITKYKLETSSSAYDYFDDDDEDDYDDDNNINPIKDLDSGILLGKSAIDDRNVNLARASYILSITSVFVLTALIVLTVAVTITLFVLKRNGAFNMHNGNLPRLKIPLWHSAPGQKKHSGSVYRPLSEDLTGPGTPIINRYEFKPSSIVHNSIP